MCCSCGFEVEKGKPGCGEVLDELVYRDKNGEIYDTAWVHCGEKGELCDECRSSSKTYSKNEVKE